MTDFTEDDAGRLATALRGLQAARDRVAELEVEARRLIAAALAVGGTPGEMFWPTRYGTLVRAEGTGGRRSPNRAALDAEYEALPQAVRDLIGREEVGTVVLAKLPREAAALVRDRGEVKVVESWPTVKQLEDLLKDPVPFLNTPVVPDRVVLQMPDGRLLTVDGVEEQPKPRKGRR